MTTFWDLSFGGKLSGCQPYLLLLRGPQVAKKKGPIFASTPSWMIRWNFAEIKQWTLFWCLEKNKKHESYGWLMLMMSTANGCKPGQLRKKGKVDPNAGMDRHWVFPWLTLSASVDWLSTEREKKRAVGFAGLGESSRRRQQMDVRKLTPKNWGNYFC